MSAFSFLLLPLFGALTGWLVVHFLLRFLFQPVKPVRLAGVTIQGFLPRRQQEIASAIGRAVANELTSLPELAERIKNPDLIAGLLPGIEAHIDTFLHTRLQEKIPVVSVFMGESTLQKIKVALIEEIELLLPDVIGQYADTLPRQLPVAQLVTERVAAMDPAALRGYLQSSYGRELRMARLLGGLIGLILGLTQAGIFAVVAR